MLYNKNNPQWKFSEDQYLRDDDYYNMVDEYDVLVKSMLKTDFRDINEKLYGVESEEENENTEQPVVDPVEPKPETPIEPQPETPVEPENP